MPETTSHVDIVMWMVSLVLAVVVLLLPSFWFLTRNLKKAVAGSVQGVKAEVKTLEMNISQDAKAFERKITEVVSVIDTKLKALDVKKVDVILYVEDREKAEAILKSLETRERADLLRTACQAHLADKLTVFQLTLDKILENQDEIVSIKETLNLVKDRQKQVIERIDKHINGK